MKIILKPLALVPALAMILLAGQAMAQGGTAARLFWQDDSGANVCWGDLKKSTSGWSIQGQAVDGFPALDVDQQSLVQMRDDGGLIVVGVHDTAEGTIGSGFVAIESGAVEESHGSHSHWKFPGPPSVHSTQIDADQGNPAHVYRYGKSIVLANDKKNGFTITSGQAIRDAKSPEQAAKFYDGGNGHITLAVVDDRVAYATWIAPAGDDMGRVDVVGLGENDGRRYSFQCPSGLLHGAGTNSGKVFFAPADGVCWVEADLEVDDDPASVQVHQLSLGVDAQDKPLRTGAFVNMGSHVLFTAGKGDDAKLCVINAAESSPKLMELPIELGEGDSVTMPVTVKARSGQSLAMMFRENKDSPEGDVMLFVDLDPNRDGSMDDMTMAGEVAVGRNQVVGHSGHHEAIVLPSRRDVVISNPADGTLSVVSLSDFTIRATLDVGGTPTRLIAIGG